jgi:hypothetical protein
VRSLCKRRFSTPCKRSESRCEKVIMSF